MLLWMPIGIMIIFAHYCQGPLLPMADDLLQSSFLISNNLNQMLFPPYIFATSRTMGTEEQEAEYIESCKRMNPDYAYKMYSDNDMRDFIVEYFPEFLELYDGFPCQVMRADLWRYLIIYKYGGVYQDTDISCNKPIDTWTDVFHRNNTSKWHDDTFPKVVRAVVGVEFSNWKEHNVTLQITQWTFAAAPRHSLFL